MCLEYFYDRATVGREWNGNEGSIVEGTQWALVVERQILEKKAKRVEKITQPFQGLTKTILRLLESGHLRHRDREEGWKGTSLSILLVVA